MCEHEGKWGGAAASLVDEMDAVGADGGHELRHAVQPGLHRTPVVLAAPVVEQPLQILGARPVGPTSVRGRPRQPRPTQPLLEIVEQRLGDVDAERLDGRGHLGRSPVSPILIRRL